MKTCFAKSILFVHVLCLLAGCSQQPAEQSVLVTVANETAVMARLRAIATAEARYQLELGGDYGSLDQLIQKGYISDPSRGKLTGYRFDIQVRRGGFQASAVPEKFPVTGTRSFYIDETNVIRGADKKGAPASASDPPV